MKNSLLGVVPLSLIAGLIFAGCAAQQEVTLELLNPMGVIEPPATLGLSARIPHLDGRILEGLPVR